ncbi:response regulator [Clostridium botulinum]|uniref:Stage 0 sporulation protein A homolog n=1 Tax=Clostridium botulinum C/D str. DC5 TaxID=1443128 RepID=A0A0A0I900_CLOBO|nr:response regulator [Clostridium botulinum]KEI01928.1 chemotaxis protein [Clostridium botulinum C/D str. BKT75002]KEI10030.1 chemotaxis protein [Clostridium botulinum C/D str. BKT2873]KGM97347.1 chemotaxis protein [Clostridium botulinum C/D str. DC5]KGM98215.1 chemotaxis protein [Clostridium botulinum D str. CCUG 7971]KOC50424.1 chemotaxis protein [Clostridium botulinum]
MKNIMIIDNKMYSRNRIKELIAEYDVNVYEAENSFQVFNILKKLNNKVELIITDVNLGKENGIDIIRKIKERGIKVPVLILTSENKRRTFIEGIKAGATDYILQPFEAKFLLKRILKDIEVHNNGSKVIKKSMKAKEQISGVEEKEIDFNKYLSDEVNNAKNSSKEFSILMLTLFKSVDEFTEKVEKEYAALIKIIYPRLKELLVGADIFIKYGPQSFVGSFKNLQDSKKQKMINNIKAIFRKAKDENKIYEEYFLEGSFAKFPADGTTEKELLSKVQDKMVDKINLIKNLER